MKKKALPIFFVLMTIIFTCLFAIQISADDGDDEADPDAPFVMVSYYVGDTFKVQERCEIGKTVTIRSSMSSYGDRTFYGWFSDDGVLYTAGDKISFTKDTKLYEAWGGVAYTEADFRTMIQKSWYYTKLGLDITTSSTLATANGGVSVVDLNGYNITSTASDDVFGEIRAGLILVGKGVVTHNSSSTASDKTGSAICRVQYHGWYDGGQRLWIGKDVTIKTDNTLLECWQDMSSGVGLPSVRIYGSVKCSMLIKSYGMANATCDIYDGAVLTVTGPYMFRDLSNIKGNLMIVNINGGTFYLGDQTEFFDDVDRYEISLIGGQYSKNIAQFISTEYRCTQNSEGMFVITDNYCPSETSPTGYHRYRATDITVTCTEEGKIFYECQYCGDQYELDRLPLGHNFTSVLAKEIVNTEEVTECGEYVYTCIRCGSSYVEYVYPDPQEVYITIKVRSDGVVSSYRVKSTQLFIFDDDDPTMIKTHNLTLISVKTADGSTKKFKAEEIISVEIPLGTTSVYGGVYTSGGSNSPLGVFYEDKYIEEIILPSSLVSVGKYAFADMASIKSIVGIENILTTIDQYAFAQLSTSELSFDTLTVNATTVAANAFKNIKATTIRFTENVASVDSNAFSLDSGLSIGLKEILVDAYEDDDGSGITLSNYNSKYNTFISIPKQGEFAQKIVYKDHNYITTDIAATCSKGSYTVIKCSYCGDTTITNENPGTDSSNHTYGEEREYVAPTCAEEGGYYKVCVDCGYRVLDGDPIPPDPDAHVLVTGYYGDVCTETHMVRKVCSFCDYIEPRTNWRIEQAQGHDFSVIVSQVDATCGSQGWIDTACSRCGTPNTEITILPKTGRHSAMEDMSQHIDANCATEGKQVYICRVCGQTINTRVIPIDETAHCWQKEESEPDNDGVITITYTCLNGCGTAHEATADEPHYRIDSEYIKNKLEQQQEKFPTWAIVLICIAGVIVLVGVLATIYFTIFKKKNKAESYKYKFNTLKKK